MDANTTLHLDNDQPPSEDTIMKTEETSETIVTKEETTEQDPLDLALDKVKKEENYASSDLDFMTTEETSETIVTKEETTEQDPLDLALDKVKKEENYDSSDLDLSSDDDSSSDGGAAHGDGDDDEDDEDDDTKVSKTAPLVSTNEVTDIQIERPNFELTESTPIAPVGTIFSVIDKTVVVQTQTHGNVLDMESLLVLTDEKVVLGEVFETFGPVDRPFYSVRFNSVDEIPSGAKSGARVAYVPSYARTQLVQVEKLKLLKGTDASNRFDEEAGDDELEFSDDEQEMAYNRSKKKGKQQRQKKKVPITTDGGPRQLQSYADIMGVGGPAAPSTAQRATNTNTMDDLLNSYMTSRPVPHNTTLSSTTTATTTVKLEQSVTSVPAQQTPVQQAPVQQVPVQQAPVQQASVQQAQVQQAPGQQALAQQTPLQQVPEQQTPVKSEVSSSTPASASSEQKPQPPPPTSFFQSIRSLFSRGPPPSSS